jgi:8-oxo-dGTP diphosphatase
VLSSFDNRYTTKRPLSINELRDVYALTDWRVILLDERLPRDYNKIKIINMFKAFALPFVIEIPSERAIFRELNEREPLQTLCGFAPGEKLPDKRTFWHFRNKLSDVFSGLMLKILISMVLSGNRPNLLLPFVTPIAESAHSPEGTSSEIKLDDYRPPIELWITTNDLSVENEAISLNTLREELKLKKNLDEYRKTVLEYEKAKKTYKRGLSGNLCLPVEVKTRLYQGEIIRFAIDKPIWFDTPTQQADTITTLGSSSFRPYSVCNVIIIKREDNKQKVLLSRRLSGFGKEFFALPGGKQQAGETLEQCTIRELKEETAMILLKSRPVSFHVTRYPGKPQVYTVGALAESYEGIPRTIEHGQNDEWRWFDLEDLPAPLFGPTKMAISQFQENKYPNLQWSDIEAQIAEGTETTEQLSLPGLI